MTELVGAARGGPQHDSGRPMGDFQQTLEQFHVPRPEQEELLAIVVAPFQDGPATVDR